MIDKEVLDGFREEALQLLGELEAITEALESAGAKFPAGELEQFAQKIDRIMGAAQTLNQLAPEHQGLQRVGAITQLCKSLGYKAAAAKASSLVPFFAAFWADTLEVLEELIENLDDDAKSKELAGAFANTLQNRLKWLGEKVQKVSPNASGAPAIASASEIEQLLKNLG